MIYIKSYSLTLSQFYYGIKSQLLTNKAIEGNFHIAIFSKKFGR